MRVPEEPVCVHLFQQKPVFTSLHLKSPVHVHRLWAADEAMLNTVHRKKIQKNPLLCITHFWQEFFAQTWQKQPSCWKRNLNVNFKLV
jgi:hypothetical protein